jgi:hypothetical protein
MFVLIGISKQLGGNTITRTLLADSYIYAHLDFCLTEWNAV